MQPRFTQVPPSAAISATATRAPSCAAMRAARTPPLPAPMMKRSNSAMGMGKLLVSRNFALSRRLFVGCGHPGIVATARQVMRLGQSAGHWQGAIP